MITESMICAEVMVCILKRNPTLTQQIILEQQADLVCNLGVLTSMAYQQMREIISLDSLVDEAIGNLKNLDGS